MKQRNIFVLSHTCKVFTVMNMCVIAVWGVTPCSDMAGYHHFRGPCWRLWHK